MLTSVLAPLLLLPIAIALTLFFKREAEASWESSHFTYTLRTFVILFIGLMTSQVLLFLGFLADYKAGQLWDFEDFMIGQAIVLMLVIPITALLCIIRTLRSMRLASKHQPMPSPGNWLF